jgi:GT2 family glycosyltransferase
MWASGTNLPPLVTAIADCVANAPVVPCTCSSLIRRRALSQDVTWRFGKRPASHWRFDPQFHAAGDDVDVCWRLQQQGWTIGFSPTAMVWHHRRNAVRTYWNNSRVRQGGSAARKRSRKYNMLGHLSWAGRLYGKGSARVELEPGTYLSGILGERPVQSVYALAPGFWVPCRRCPSGIW